MAAVVIKFVTENNVNSDYINHIQIDIFISYTTLIATCFLFLVVFCCCSFFCFFFFLGGWGWGCFVFLLGVVCFVLCACFSFLELVEYPIACLISCLFGRWDQEKPHRKEL